MEDATGVGLARRTDPETSHIAARLVAGRRAVLILPMLRYFAEHDYLDGLISDDLAQVGLGGSGAWRRVSEMKAAGWIRAAINEHGEEVRRPGRLSARATQTSYRITPAGRAVLAHLDD